MLRLHVLADSEKNPFDDCYVVLLWTVWAVWPFSAKSRDISRNITRKIVVDRRRGQTDSITVLSRPHALDSAAAAASAASRRTPHRASAQLMA